MAERVGFEPTEPRDSPHFECGALDHYATSPIGAPGGNRTPDAFLRTEALYPLSYGGTGAHESSMGHPEKST